MTQAVTSPRVPRETDHSHRQRQAQRLAAAVLLGLTAGCAGAGTQEAYRGDDRPFWHEEEQRDDSAGSDSTS